MAESFENLNVWNDSIELASKIYFETKKFPSDERFGLVSQLRRAVVSISANVAEGSGRTTKKEFARFIDISIGSLNEVESLMHISKKLGYLSEKKFDEIVVMIKRLGSSLGAFRKYLLK